MTECESPNIADDEAWKATLRIFGDLIETIVSKEIEQIVDGLTQDQLLDLRIATLRKLDDAIAVKLGAPVIAVAVEPKVDQSKHLQTLAQSPLTLAIPQYLLRCDEPQTAKQIAAALIEAGREFESKRPVHAVRMTLAKLVGTNPDIFHVYWAKWWLKSKCTKTQLEKYLAKNARFGTGGHSKKEHSKRTADGIAKRRSKGLQWGATRKATPELLDRARQMLRDGVSLTEVCRTLDIATPTLYQFGIKQRELKKEGELLRQKQSQQEPTASPDGGADVIPLHGRGG